MSLLNDEAKDKVPVAFGKHRSKTPEQIAEIEPGYLVWAYEQFSAKPCSRKLYLACVDAVEKDKQDREDDEESKPQW